MKGLIRTTRSIIIGLVAAAMAARAAEPVDMALIKNPPPAAPPSHLNCEYLTDPLGIDVVKPRLSWKMENQKSEILNPKSEIPRGQKQAAYQVLVASSAELLKKDKGDLWDSGKVESDQSTQVEYAGKPLESRMQCYWKVKVWTPPSDL